MGLHKSTPPPTPDHPDYVFSFQRFNVRQGRRSVTGMVASHRGLFLCLRVGAILDVSIGIMVKGEGLTAPIHNGSIPLLGSSSLEEILDCTFLSHSFCDVTSKSIPASFSPASTVCQDTRMGCTT